MSDLDRIRDVIENWRQGYITAVRAIIYIKRILEEENDKL